MLTTLKIIWNVCLCVLLAQRWPVLLGTFRPWCHISILTVFLFCFVLTSWDCWWARFERGDGVMESVRLECGAMVQGKVHRWELYTLSASFSHIYLKCCDIRQYCTLMVSHRYFHLKCFYLFKNNSWIYKIKDKLSNKILIVIFWNLLKSDLGTLKAVEVSEFSVIDWNSFWGAVMF